ncbi:MAG TPA: hypothetical protein VLW06_09175 [Terriglobales bacterium]|nr:hypothetical protein [Terriglobales bacterium]
MLSSIGTRSSILGLVLSACSAALAMCPVGEVIVRGRVVNPPNDAKVLVQLVYANNVVGESGDTTLDNDKFSLPLDFLTESRRPIIDGSFGKCARRPTTVVVKLLDNRNQSYDSVSLDFAKDFKQVYQDTYALKSELVLRGAP